MDIVADAFGNAPWQRLAVATGPQSMQQAQLAPWDYEDAGAGQGGRALDAVSSVSAGPNQPVARPEDPWANSVSFSAGLTPTSQAFPLPPEEPIVGRPLAPTTPDGEGELNFPPRKIDR